MTTDDLYHASMIGWAKRQDHIGTLENPDHRATVSNPLCGDRVTVDLRMKLGRITAVAYEVRGCLLSKASCARVASLAEGMDRNGIIALHQNILKALQASDADGIDLPDELMVFKPVKSRKSRHGCLLIVFEAILEALGGAHP